MNRVWIIALALVLVVRAPVLAADSKMFNGKTITYIVATDAGGRYDTYGRLIARYLQKHLSGSRVLVRDVPWERAIKGADMIYAAKPDGLTMGMFNPGLIFDQLVGRDGIMFDLTKFSWIGRAAFDARTHWLCRRYPWFYQERWPDRSQANTKGTGTWLIHYD